MTYVDKNKAGINFRQKILKSKTSYNIYNIIHCVFLQI